MRRKHVTVAVSIAACVFFSASPVYADSDQQACEVGSTHYIDEKPPALDQVGFPEAWKLSRGNVLVAVVDSGVDANNAHLTGVVKPGLDLVDGGDGWTDVAGHGTVVAGIIAARPAQGSGLVGSAPDATILPVRVYADDSSQSVDAGRGPEPGRTAQGIRWAADQGARIIAVPLSISTDESVLREAVEYATTKGALVVASSGNTVEGVEDDAARYPAGYPEVLSVTALDSAGLPSNAVSHGDHVEIAAPGQAVLSTFLSYGDCIFAGSSPSTSYATGYVAGAAALVASAHPDESPSDWHYRLLATALRPSQAQRDATIGWGIVAPFDAVNFINDGSAPGPQNPQFPSGPQEEKPVATMPRPGVTPDPVPERRMVVGVMAVGAAAVTVAVLLVGRLWPPRRRTAEKNVAR